MDFLEEVNKMDKRQIAYNLGKKFCVADQTEKKKIEKNIDMMIRESSQKEGVFIILNWSAGRSECLKEK
jgi:hypothetical protein